MRAKKERRCDWADGRARKWKSYYHNLEKETEEKATRRLGNEIERREEQSKAFVTWNLGPRQAVWSAKGDRIQWETWRSVEMA